MAFAISNWGSEHLNWLQHGECSGSCSTTDTFSQFRNLEFRTANYVPPTPVDNPVDETEYVYERPCYYDED